MDRLNKSRAWLNQTVFFPIVVKQYIYEYKYGNYALALLTDVILGST